jgi:hypothetical protein
MKKLRELRRDDVTRIRGCEVKRKVIELIVELIRFRVGNQQCGVIEAKYLSRGPFPPLGFYREFLKCTFKKENVTFP